MEVRFGELAQREFEDARAWYEAQQPGLSAGFSAQIEAAARRIGRMPSLYGD